MTNDQSLSHSWINPPKRPHIPPPSQQHNVQQSRRPAINSKYNSYGNGFNNNCQPTESFYDFDHHQQSYRNLGNHSSPYTENKNFLQGITQQYDS